MNTEKCDTCGAVMIVFPGAPFAGLTRAQCQACATQARAAVDGITSAHYITAEEALDGRAPICATCENRWAKLRTDKDVRARAGRWTSGARRDHYVIDGRGLCGRQEGR